MSRGSDKDARFFGACAGLMAYAVSWLFLGSAPLPRLWYDPLIRQWSWQVTAPGVVAMDWYGRLLQGVVCGLLIGFGAWWATSRFLAGASPARLRTWRGLAAWWAVGLVVVAFVLYGVTLANRVIAPPGTL